jgi:hypothetical protein
MPETALDFLRRPGNRTRIRRLIEALTGRQLNKSTTTRWGDGSMQMSAPAEALIELVQRNPELMETER